MQCTQCQLQSEKHRRQTEWVSNGTSAQYGPFSVEDKVIGADSMGKKRSTTEKPKRRCLTATLLTGSPFLAELKNVAKAKEESVNRKKVKKSLFPNGSQKASEKKKVTAVPRHSRTEENISVAGAACTDVLQYTPRHTVLLRDAGAPNTLPYWPAAYLWQPNPTKNFRICPGKKDYVSVKLSSGGRQHEQKRLLLVNLKELYLDFGKITGIHVGFSTFCALPPKSCVTVVSSGAHSVCVCEQHQNAKLLLAALPVQIDYKELLDVMVCHVTERQCMLRECDPWMSWERGNHWISQEAVWWCRQVADREDKIEYKQWRHTVRTALTDVNMCWGLCWTSSRIIWHLTAASHHCQSSRSSLARQ